MTFLAGLTKIAESKPDPRILEAVKKLRAFGFNPIFLSSEEANLEKLRRVSIHEVEQVKNIFKGFLGPAARIENASCRSMKPT